MMLLGIINYLLKRMLLEIPRKTKHAFSKSFTI